MSGRNSYDFSWFCRFLESHWFVWVTQMNHIPMEIDSEKHRDWLSSQVTGRGENHPQLTPKWDLLKEYESYHHPQCYHHPLLG